MGRKFTVVIERDEDGWLVSSVVELPGCHTQAKGLDQLMIRTKEAIQAYLGVSKHQDIYEEFINHNTSQLAVWR